MRMLDGAYDDWNWQNPKLRTLERAVDKVEPLKTTKRYSGHPRRREDEEAEHKPPTQPRQEEKEDDVKGLFTQMEELDEEIKSFCDGHGGPGRSRAVLDLRGLRSRRRRRPHGRTSRATTSSGKY